MRTALKIAILSLAAVGTAACGSGSERERAASASAALLGDAATTRILGFESLGDWSIQQGPGTLSLSTVHTQGSSSLALTGPAYTVVQSANLSTLGNVGTTLAVDYQVPSTLSWGTLALILNSPTLGLYNDFIGQVSVSGVAPGAFHTATFTLPSSLVTQLAGSYTDLQVRFNWNVPTASGAFLLDNARFPNATADAGAADATASDASGHDAASDGAGEASASDGSITPRTVFAKPNFKQITVNDVVPNRVFEPQGVVVDRNVHPNAVYVFDSVNQRVIGFKSLGTCSTSGAACTYDAECPSPQTCTIPTVTRNADLVFGQPDLYSTTCNGDDTTSQPATASTLCTMPYPRSVSILESGDAQSMSVDSQSNLYVMDKWNQRVLRYNNPLKTDSVADMVWGQPDMVSRQCNQGGTPTASTLCLDNELTGNLSGNFAGGGVEAMADGSVWVTDQGNSRVLRFPPSSNVANMVLGQSSFTNGTADANECDPTQTINTGAHLCLPKAVRYNPSTKQLYVLDWKTGTQKFRVLIYTAKGGDFAMGQQADTVVVGDPGYQCIALNDCPYTPDAGVSYTVADASFQWNRPSGLELPQSLQANAFWLADGKNSRVVSYALKNGTWAATQVLGETSPVATTGVNPCPVNTLSNDWCNVFAPGGSMGIDGAGNVYVADEDFPRVMRYPAASGPTLDGGTQAPVVANAILFPMLSTAGGTGLENNAIDAKGAFSLNKVKLATYSSGAPQMLLFDQFRFLFWNNYSSASSGQAADGVLYQSDLMSNVGNYGLGGLDTDSKGHVFVGVGGHVDVYQGPLTSLQTATVASFDVSTVPLRVGGGTLAGNILITGLAYDPTNDALFLADTASYRIIRIGSPLTSSRQINLVLGQTDNAHFGANRSQDDATKNTCLNVQPDGFGNMSQLKLDKQGNLYVVDAIHEGWACSNNRVVEYDAATVLPASTDFIACSALTNGCASKRPTRYFVAGNPSSGTYPISGLQIGQTKGYLGSPFFGNGDAAPNVPIGLTFDSSGHMILVVDAYENSPTHRVFYYATPVPSCSSSNPGCYVPFTSIFPALASQPTDVSFDPSNNMVLMDQTWARVTYYSGTDYSAWVATQPAH